MDHVMQAVRPGYCKSGSPVPLFSNYFPFTHRDPNTVIQRYCIDFEPDIPSSLSKQRERILFRAKNEIKASIGIFVFANTILFSTRSSPEFSVVSTYDNVTYTLSIKPTGIITSPQEIKHFYNKFFNSVQGKLNLVMIGRKFYNPDRPVDLPQHKLTVWPGYSNAVGYFEEGCLLNIDISHRCLRTISVYDQISDIKKRNPHDFRPSVEKLLIGSSVLTLYNKKCYKVDDIEWDKSPSSTFEKAGVATDFKQYYSTRWGRQIVHEDQPLLKSKLKTMECFL